MKFTSKKVQHLPNQTKKALADAFVRHVTTLKKPFHQLKINHLSKLAGIHRITFYQHFSGSEDFIKWFLHKDLIFKIEPNQVLRIEDALTTIYRYVQSQRKVLQAIFSSSYGAMARQFIVDEALTYQLTNIARIDTEHALSLKERKTYALFYAEGITHLIMQYIQDPETSQYALETYVHMSEILVKNYIERIVGAVKLQNQTPIFR